MANHDLSRHLLRPLNRYTGVRMQQGRNILDSDFGEGEMLDDADHRAVVVDVVGPHGSADYGFTIANPNPKVYDFDILAGSYYLGGMRHEIVGQTGLTSPQRFRHQTDWTLTAPAGGEPHAPQLPPAEREDLVYLIGWEQSVSSVEDREFLEMALGGPDTSDRVRRMHRVYVREGGPEDCQDAFQALVDALTDDEHHTFDWTHHELLSGARLTVVMEDASQDNVCKPAIPAGYTGAENQAIRIQLIAPDRFLWSFDNAAPLYRVKLSHDSLGTHVEFLTTPRDQAHYPTAGQVFELLHWGAILPNGEHVANHQIAADIGGSVYAHVTTPYDPATRTVRVNGEQPDALAAISNFHYLRVWNPGGGALKGPVGLPFQPGVAVALAGTGLQARFSQVGIVGDFWILAARTATVTEVVPWALQDSEAPHGPRRFYCPLAMLHWSMVAGVRTVDVHSCRRTFRPLTRQKGCCTVTVGDGEKTFGDYTSINEALRAIPFDEAGKICVLPGVYEERVIIQDRSDIVIEGCGPASILRTPPSNATSQGLVTITACANITLKDLKIEATGQFGVMIHAAPLTVSARSSAIKLVQLDVSTRRDAELAAPTFSDLWIPAGSSPFPLCTVAAYHMDGLTIQDCRLTMFGALSGAPNVSVVSCDQVNIRDCQIHTPSDADPYSEAWGGVQLGATCRDIVIESCEIHYGIGCGITLGKATVVGFDTYDYRSVFDPVGRFVLTEGVTDPGSNAAFPTTAVPPGGGDPDAVSLTGELTDVCIIGNRVRYMGSSGISVLGFLPEPAVPTGNYLSVITSDFVIADNLLETNYQRPAEEGPPAGYENVVAFGGIVLADADGLRIHDNQIQGNGVSHLRPVCGIYVLHGTNIVIENNRVQANGPRVEGAAEAGTRAGIALQLAGRRVSTSFFSFTVEPDLFLSAARVRGNLVSQPAGRALQMYGLGPMFIEGNVLVSEGPGVDATSDVTGQCIDIQNIGQSPELVAAGWIPADLGFFPAPPLLFDPYPFGLVDEQLLDGRILFTDNQVRFNPVDDEATGIFCATRLQSYGDVALRNNQFFVKFGEGSGSMVFDTTVTAWSTRTTSNRWEDPAIEDPPGTFQTDTSLTTLAVMNITAMNQATRCIHVDVSASALLVAIDNNQTYTDCGDAGALGGLLAPP